MYPISWIIKSQKFVEYVSSTKLDDLFLVADFASGEYDRVPSFFVKIWPQIQPVGPKRTVVYCTDVHALRLDSLMGKLEESSLLKNVRVVQAKLETMDEEANLRPDMLDYLEDNNKEKTYLDIHLREKRFIPKNVFDLGVLNNDVVGYLHEYYKEYSDALVGLRKIHESLKKGALLIVTMPCSLYTVDNVKVLESVGFEFLEGRDIALSDGSVSEVSKDTDPKKMSRLGHYTFLIFVSK